MTPSVLGALREIADVEPGDVASFGMVRIGDADAREILDALDTLAAVRRVLIGPNASLQMLRVLLAPTTHQTIRSTEDRET